MRSEYAAQIEIESAAAERARWAAVLAGPVAAARRRRPGFFAAILALFR
jgi:hypothetical protein